MKRLRLFLAVVLTFGALGARAQSRLPLAQMPAIDATALLEHIKVLASDRFEGRLPGTRGEELTVAYLVDELKRLGLKPGNTDGTYVQAVPLVGLIPSVADTLTFSRGEKRETLTWRTDYVAWTGRAGDSVALDGSELVFVGYGVQAPEFKWDDFKDMDLAGKTLVVLVGDPPVEDPQAPGRLDPSVFGGPAMTYYGRWTYKFEKGAAAKAAGLLIVHETAPAGYGWSVVEGFGDERFTLRSAGGDSDKLAVEGWITSDRARQLFAMAGHDFDTLKRAAVRRDFKPVPLAVTASVRLRVARRNVDSRNVLARLEGSDPTVAAEHVVYTAHWDHLGVGNEVDGDSIYNGAKDNASGTAGLLEIARGFTQVEPRPRRSVLFLFVTAEEQGLLGSQFYAEHPVYPLRKTLASLNLDGLNVAGRTRNLTVIGLGSSNLDEYAREAAAEQGRTLRPDAEPEKGFYYRSDHFNFAKVGVPAFDPDDGIDFVGRPTGFGPKVRADYTSARYHRPQDEVRPDWDLSGAVDDLTVLFAMGYRVANADVWPSWRPGSEFKAVRDEALNKSGSR